MEDRTTKSCPSGQLCICDLRSSILGQEKVPMADAGREISLLHYRPWRGEFRGPAWAVWPIARTALGTLLRRKLFWCLYAAGLLVFLMFFFGTFLLDWAQTQL